MSLFGKKEKEEIARRSIRNRHSPIFRIDYCSVFQIYLNITIDRWEKFFINMIFLYVTH